MAFDDALEFSILVFKANFPTHLIFWDFPFFRPIFMLNPSWQYDESWREFFIANFDFKYFPMMTKFAARLRFLMKAWARRKFDLARFFVGKTPITMTAVKNEGENLLAMAIIGQKLIYELFCCSLHRMYRNSQANPQSQQFFILRKKQRRLIWHTRNHRLINHFDCFSIKSSSSID